MDAHAREIIRGETPTELFRGLVHDAVSSLHAHPSSHGEFYLVDLLTRALHADRSLHDGTPLAERLLQAHAGGSRECVDLLKAVGDRALFVAGVVPESLTRKVVGVAYYEKMGRIAFTELADEVDRSSVAEVYSELAADFPVFVRILAEVSEHALGHGERHILSACEKWIHTGSPAAWQRLSRAGVLAPSHYSRSIM